MKYWKSDRMYEKGEKMSTAKQSIINRVSVMSDGIQDEFEILENLYKLLKLEKSRQSVKEEGGYSTEEVRKYFQKKHIKDRMTV